MLLALCMVSEEGFCSTTSSGVGVECFGGPDGYPCTAMTNLGSMFSELYVVVGVVVVVVVVACLR